jgi:hypothetical protein
MTTMTTRETVEVLEEAKATIGRLIAGIEQHHATSNCYDSGVWALASAEYKVLDNLRSAIASTKESPVDLTTNFHR